ncbi:MAG: amidophosphoribosyltransferase [Bacteroidetes bacterium GWC2_33_15]|nr:MAG: amidophosphoribosyltransferase [Bacteroidetes bacterium GWA2_33_15]OFX51237.1 MAG: amidophosphoribosyltransferase [Bacteroidetes bacterium GWC2_33_15]OFX66347.1 MAG: amidophosphoribosyltransferase [Bacteroidetes bacterium GWB2_32_14]OFX70640.1 MAG: amidophosphoribosyltransferase [Bacteroidetes bacterium GWD2_33_33]HAN18773.1 amidophosphoribosyltransferase [Bacteroidales bacterium]
MSDQIKHECGIALIRLLKPLEYYQSKYGSWMYGLHKLYLLMEKQHNRGQDGAGLATLKLNPVPGRKYIHRFRSNGATPIKEVFAEVNSYHDKVMQKNPELLNDPVWAKENLPSAASIYMGHLRYGTFGGRDIEFVQPLMRENNWKSRNLILAGNFNMTNVDELFKALIDLGQHPKEYSDTVTVLEKVGHFLDEENQLLFRQYKNEGLSNKEISDFIAKNLDVKKILQEASRDWDGGYAMVGVVGHGDAFVTRDPWGIRPAFYYHDDEIVVVASERPVIQTVMNVKANKIHEINPGEALIIKNDGRVTSEEIRVPQKRSSCSFERIYFSRGSDMDIYQERKQLGRLLVPSILKAIKYDIENTVFSFIPNTAETAFYGMVDGLKNHLLQEQRKEILALGDKLNEKEFDRIMSEKIRVEKIAVKDIKLRTFITQDKGRNDLVNHVYDITYGTIREGLDNLVIIDDSIVRGTTLRESILRILDRLKPKKIIIVSSSPQIRYPDCYGIDMAKLADFVAFRAAIDLLKESGKEHIINDVYKKSKAQENLPKEEIVNFVKEIYKPFTPEDISLKIAELLKSKEVKADVEIVFQSIEDLHAACPQNTGDWYFTGKYPTPGGNKVANKSFINFIEGKNQRAY